MTRTSFRHRMRLKYCAAIEMGQSPPSARYSSLPEVGLPFLQGTADFGAENPSPRVYCELPAKVARAGDILLSVRAPVGVLNLADQDVGIGRGLCAIRSAEFGDARFAWWALHESCWQLDYVSTGSTYSAVSVDDVGNLLVATHSQRRQRAIASYLDRETARIAALLAVQERVLDLLGERRRAIIARAVTRGLNPDAPLRDSGIPWLGEIPAHWDIERARWLFTERDQRSATGDEELLTVSHLTGVTPRSQKNVNMFEAATTMGYKICIAGDLVVNTMWAWMGAMGVAPMDGIVSPAYNVYEPRARIYPGYAAALTRMPVFAQEAGRHSKGVWSSRLRLYPQEFFAIFLPVPPLAEQREIAAHVDRWTAKLAELQSATRATMMLLEERRTALIAAVVAGHIDVEDRS